MISFSFLVVVSRDQMFKGFTHLSPLNITKAGFFTPCYNQLYNSSLAAFFLSLPGKIKGNK
tara:strand:+ start:359 stop:541 length:183 start_codon:yes stop_codon:yes gene_type:complete